MSEVTQSQTQAAVCDVDDCKEIATGVYQWDWGDKGACCDKHGLLLRQKAGHLERQVHIAPLVNGPPVPMGRDERIMHNATRLALESEIEQLKHNGAELYQSNTQLGNECRRLAARNQQMGVQLRDAKAQLEELNTAHNQALVERNDALTELQRVKLLVPMVPNTDLDPGKHLNL